MSGLELLVSGLWRSCRGRSVRCRGCVLGCRVRGGCVGVGWLGRGWSGYGVGFGLGVSGLVGRGRE